MFFNRTSTIQGPPPGTQYPKNYTNALLLHAEVLAEERPQLSRSPAAVSFGVLSPNPAFTHF